MTKIAKKIAPIQEWQVTVFEQANLSVLRDRKTNLALGVFFDPKSVV